MHAPRRVVEQPRPALLPSVAGCPTTAHPSKRNCPTLQTARSPSPVSSQILTSTGSRRGQVVRAAPEALAETPTILVSEKLSSAGLDILRQFGNVDTSYGLSPEQLLQKIAEADALIIRSETQVTRQVFEAAKGRLKVVGRAGVGVDNVDLTAATECGCLVVNAPTANTVAAAEHGIALICALSRNVAQADASMKQGKWERSKYVGVSIVGKTLAIMGFGKVGSEVARRGLGLGFAKVIAYDPYASASKAAALGVPLVTFDEALQQGDFFSLHMPLTEGTKGIFGDSAFAKIKRGARIVNVARGGVVNDEALERALESGAVAQAALDVFSKEPPPASNPLINRPDVVCTPHLGASTTEAQEGVSLEIASAVVGALRGELAATAVNAPMVPAEVLRELQPYVSLAEGLGRAAVQLVSTGGFTDIHITYATPRGDDLDTRLLRAMVIKGILEQITTATVNLVNADVLARARGLRIIESTVPAAGKDVLSTLRVALGTHNTLFSAALSSGTGQISVTGSVKASMPYLVRIGSIDVDLLMEGIVMLVRQTDRPGLIAAVCSVLAKANINVSFMTVNRLGKGKDAIMAIGLDEKPDQATQNELPQIAGIQEITVFAEPMNVHKH